MTSLNESQNTLQNTIVKILTFGTNSNWFTLASKNSPAVICYFQYQICFLLWREPLVEAENGRLPL